MQLEFQFRPAGAAGAAAPGEDFTASLFTALEEKWGLKLRPAKGNIEVIVVDRTLRPTEN